MNRWKANQYYFDIALVLCLIRIIEGWAKPLVWPEVGLWLIVLGSAAYRASFKDDE